MLQHTLALVLVLLLEQGMANSFCDFLMLWDLQHAMIAAKIAYLIKLACQAIQRWIP
jgi:hypothetical protein